MVSQGPNLRAVLSLDAKGFQGELKQSEKGLQGFSNKLKDLRLPLLAVGGALTGLGGFALKSAVDFETAFTGVRKTVDATEEQFAALEKGIKDMSRELPASTTEIAAVAEAAGQLGIETENILGFTRTMIDLGETTNLSAEEAATALARLANITGLPQTEFDRLGSTIVELGNNLATTEAEIVEMGLRLAGAGKQVGLTEAEILAMAGSLSSVGIAAEAGGTAFSRVMIELNNAAELGGEKLNQFAEVAGMSADDFARAFQEDPAEAIQSFIEGLGNIGEAGGNLSPILDELALGDIRVSDALRRAAGASDVFSDALRQSEGAWKENSALADEAAERYDTTAAKAEILKNNLNLLAVDVGEQLLPALEKSVEWLTDLAGWVEDLPPDVKTVGIAISGVALAFVGLGLVIPPAIGLMAAFGVTSNIALAGIPLLIAGIVAGAALIITHWEEVVDFMKGAGGWILAAFGPIGVAAKLTIDNWELVSEVIIATVNVLIEKVNDSIDILNAMIRAVSNVTKQFGFEISEIEWEMDRWNGIIRDTGQAHKDLETEVGGALEDMGAHYADLSDYIRRSQRELTSGLIEEQGKRNDELGDLQDDALERQIQGIKWLHEWRLAEENSLTNSLVGIELDRQATLNAARLAAGKAFGTLPPGNNPLKDFFNADRADRQAARAKAADLQERLNAGEFKDSGLFFQDAEGNVLSHEQQIRAEIERLKTIGGGNLSGPGLENFAAQFSRMNVPPAALGATMPGGTTVVNSISITVQGDIHTDDVERISEAVNEGIRRGMITEQAVIG